MADEVTATPTASRGSDRWREIVSPDDTIVSVGAPNPGLQNIQSGTRVQGSVVDMYYGTYNSDVNLRDGTNTCGSCVFSSEFSGMSVYLNLDGVKFVDLPLQ